MSNKAFPFQKLARTLIALIFIFLSIVNLIYIDLFELFLFESGWFSLNLTFVIVRLFIFAELVMAIIMIPFHPSRYRLFISIALIVSLSIPFCVTPPSFLAKKWYAKRVSYDATALDEFINSVPSLSDGKQVVAFYGKECKYCERAERKLVIIAQKSNHPDKFHVVFREDRPSVSHFESTFAPRDLFIKITNGRIPLILLLDNGEVVEKYSYAIIDDKTIISFLES